MVGPSHVFHIADYAVFGVTILISISIGIYYAFAGDRQRTTAEYLVGGRAMKFLPVAISLMVSFESSIMMLGLPAEAYVYGIQWWISTVGFLVSNMASVFIVVPLLHPLKITSAYEYLQFRFNSRAVRLLGSFLGIFTNIWYMGVVLFGPAIALEAVTGFSQWGSIFVVAFVAVVYTTIGGLKAVIWTDVFQAFVMYAGMFALLIKGTIDVGSPAKVWEIAREGGRLNFFNFDLDPRTRHTFWNLFFGTLIRGFGLAFNQSTIQRISSTKSEKEAKCSEACSPQQAAPHEQSKFLVFESCLRDLFLRCRRCQEACTVKFTTCGSAVTVSSTCRDCSDVWNWCSQPKVRQAFAGNLLLSAAILFSGCLAGKVFRFLDTLKVVRMSRSTHFYHQKRYLHATVHGVWAEEQQRVVAALREAERPLYLAGDGRSDSPGHCAKYGGYTIVECQVKRVLDVQVVQSNEVTSSNACELEGMKRALAYVESQDLRVDTVITDRHRSIAKYVRDEHPQVRHFYDTWHVAKGLGKKLDSLASKKGCELVGDWRKSITNHIHWCAATTPDGNGDLMLAKWLSLLNHLVNIHDGHGREFPSCEHEEIGERDDKEWFEPGTEIYTRLGDILENKFLLKDVRQLSPLHQTSGLEAFHSPILSFAPKNVAFSYLGMRSRVLLIMAPCFFLSLSMACYEGIVAFAYYQTKGCDPLASKKITNPNQVIPFTVMDIFHDLPGMPGLFLASLFSASLSTLSSSLSSLSALLWTDFLQHWFDGISEFKATLIAKSSVVVFGLLGCGVALLVSLIGGPLTQISGSLSAAFGGPLTGLFLMGCFCPWTNAKGALFGGILSLILTSWLSLGKSFAKNVKRAPWLPPASTEMCLANHSASSLFQTTTPSGGYSSGFTDAMLNFTHHDYDMVYGFQFDGGDHYSTISAAAMDTTTQAAVDDGPQGIDAIYTMSYQWLAPVSILITVILGTVISLATGGNKKGDVHPRYLLGFCDHLCCCLPECFRKVFRCADDYTTVKAEDAPPLHELYLDTEIIITTPANGKPEHSTPMILATEVDGHVIGSDEKNGNIPTGPQNGGSYVSFSVSENGNEVAGSEEETKENNVAGVKQGEGQVLIDAEEVH